MAFRQSILNSTTQSPRRAGGFRESAFEVAKLPNVNRAQMADFDPGFLGTASGTGDGLAKTLAKQVEVFGETTTSLLPFTKYLNPEKRKEFEELTDGEQVADIAWESVGLALIAAGPAIWKGVKAAGKLATGRVGKAFVPVEDAVRVIGEKGVWRGFHYEDSIRQLLKSKRFASDEAEAIAKGLARGGDDLIEVKALMWEKGDKVSKAFKESVKLKSNTPYGKVLLNDELKTATDFQKRSYQHWKRLYESNLNKTVFAGSKKVAGKTPGAIHSERFVKDQLRTIYGEQAATKFTIDSLDEQAAANLISDMFRPKEAKFFRRAGMLGRGLVAPTFRPERHTWGMGESLFGAKSKIFDVVVDAKNTVNDYVFQKTRLFSHMLEEAGLGKVKYSKFGYKFKPGEGYTKRVTEEAYGILKQIDDLSEAARTAGGGKKAVEARMKQVRVQMSSLLSQASPEAKKLVYVTRNFNDYLYKELLQQRVPQLLNRYAMTPLGRQHADALLALHGPKVEAAFKTMSELQDPTRVGVIKAMLKDFKEMTKPEMASLFFKNPGKDAKKLADLSQALSYGKDFGWPAYLENYTARVYQGGVALQQTWSKDLTKNASGFFMKGRQFVAPKQRVTDFADMVEARVRAQGKQLYFYDEVNSAVRYAKTLPTDWQLHTEHLLARALGRPSQLDHAVARFLEASVGKISAGAGRVLGKESWLGEWDKHRVMRLAQKINSNTFAGFLGLKPYATIRNLVQPLVTVPADLGGTKDFYNLARGIGRAASPKFRTYMQEIGAITEFIPEQQAVKHLPRFGFGAKYDEFRDFAMWMYRGSDRWNRYVSGGAALNKWERAAKAVGNIEQNSSKFLQKINVAGREAWERSEIENLVKLGRIDEAKAKYVKSVVADTQYLYGGLEAPSRLGMHGGTGRTVFAFQSWWMNYGALVSKWIRTGQSPGAKVERMVTAMFSAAAAEQTLEPMFGREKASKSIGLGPFPFQGVAPPAFEPIVQGIRAAYGYYNYSIGLGSGKEELRKANKRFEASLRSLGRMTVPGALQFEKIATQASKGKLLDPATLGFKQDPGYKPLWGIGQ